MEPSIHIRLVEPSKPYKIKQCRDSAYQKQAKKSFTEGILHICNSIFLPYTQELLFSKLGEKISKGSIKKVIEY